LLLLFACGAASFRFDYDGAAATGTVALQSSFRARRKYVKDLPKEPPPAQALP